MTQDVWEDSRANSKGGRLHGLDSSSNFHEILTFVPNARLVGKEESTCKQGGIPNRESCDPRPYVISPVCADGEMLGWFVGEVGSCRVNDGRRFESKDVSWGWGAR